MDLVKTAIIKKGKVLSGEILKVGSFLNHNIDVNLLSKMADDIANHFSKENITKVLTVEASGIALAILVAEHLNVEMVFAKKSKSSNVDGEVYTSKCFSFTHNNLNELIVPKEYIKNTDNVLIIDDFLATGEALKALTDIVKQANAVVSGVGIAIEKGFQHGGDEMRKQGIDVYSLAIIESMEKDKIVFRN